MHVHMHLCVGGDQAKMSATRDIGLHHIQQVVNAATRGMYHTALIIY